MSKTIELILGDEYIRMKDGSKPHYSLQTLTMAMEELEEMKEKIEHLENALAIENGNKGKWHKSEKVDGILEGVK